ncbi:hypothetical protein [Photorhabdus laumondii]
MTGVSECSQQRGNLKDNGYITDIKNEFGIYPSSFIIAITSQKCVITY